MKRVIFITAVCAFVLASAPVMADMIVNLKYNFPGRVGSTNGGEFLMTVVDDPIGIYSQNDQFTSFCVEKDEYVSNDKDYFVTISTAAVNGGIGGGTPDPLSFQSAYLYSLWLDGIDADGNTIDKADQTTVNNIQKAIWHFEDEGSDPLNPFVAQANAAVLGSWGNTLGDIRVMNLWKYENHTGIAQDQLVRVPTPTAILLGLLGLSVAGVKLRKYA